MRSTPQHVKELRRAFWKSGMRKSRFADAAGIPRCTLDSFLNGKVNTSDATIRKIAHTLGMKIRVHTEIVKETA